MQSLVKFAAGPNSMRVQDMPEPELLPGHVIIQVKAAGICGTDLHIQAGEYPVQPPVILGHEFSGVVAAVAPDVTETRVGERVTSLVYYTTCGSCEFCSTGQWNLCKQRKSIGSGVNGAFAPYVRLPKQHIRALPENTGFPAGAIIEPLACCTHGVFEKARIKAGDLAVVMGPGAIGLMTAQIALAAGAVVVLVGTAADQPRLQVARELGIQHTAAAETDDPAGLVDALSQGRGADVIFECSGAGAAAKGGLKLLRRQGQFIQLGLFGKPIELDWDSVMLREIEIQNSFASTWRSWEYALRLVAQGKVQLAPLISDVLPLAQWEGAFMKFRQRQGLKYILVPE